MTERDILDEWNAVVATQEAPRGSIMWKVLDAAKRVVGMLEARVQHGSRLLRQVVIRDGCGAWTSDAARDAWCSSLKDWQPASSARCSSVIGKCARYSASVSGCT